jgi:hypothetical protein
VTPGSYATYTVRVGKRAGAGLGNPASRRYGTSLCAQASAQSSAREALMPGSSAGHSAARSAAPRREQGAADPDSHPRTGVPAHVGSSDMRRIRCDRGLGATRRRPGLLRHLNAGGAPGHTRRWSPPSSEHRCSSGSTRRCELAILRRELRLALRSASGPVSDSVRCP